MSTTRTVLTALAEVVPSTRAHLVNQAEASDFHIGARHLIAVGIREPRSARIWVRTDRAGPHVVRVTGPDHHELRVPFDAPTDPAVDGTTAVRIDGLTPLTEFRFEVAAED